MNKTGCIDLLEEVSEHLEAMRSSGEIKVVKVKSILEHLRSCLEYFANDTYKIITTQKTARLNVYFPYKYPQKINDFFTKVLKVAPGEFASLFDLITSIQDYHSGDNWLVMMCNLTNDAKHRQPIPLDSQEVIKKTAVSVGNLKLFDILGPTKNVTIDIGRVRSNGMVVHGLKWKDGNLTTQNTNHQNAVNICITRKNEIRFHGHDYEVIPFLDKCLNHLKEFIPKAYAILDELSRALPKSLT